MTVAVSYNSGRRGDERGFVASSYFTFIPSDYDNSFGIDFPPLLLDHVELLLDTDINPAAIAAVIRPDGGGLWDRVARPAYLESDTPHGWPFTGRQFTNHEVWRNGHEQEELQKGEETALGILEYVRMRHDSARAQLAVLRREHPAGSSRAAFPVALEPVP